MARLRPVLTVPVAEVWEPPVWKIEPAAVSWIVPELVWTAPEEWTMFPPAFRAVNVVFWVPLLVAPAIVSWPVVVIWMAPVVAPPAEAVAFATVRPPALSTMVIAPAGVAHGIRNTGEARLLVLAVLAPAPA